MDVGSLVSEFPNDNPALHGGVRWVCLEVTGLCSAERPVEAIASAVVDAVAAADAVAEAAADVVAEAVAEADPVADADAVAEALEEALADACPPVLESGIVLSAHADDEDDEIIVEELEPLGELEPEAAPLVMVATETLPPPMMMDSEPPPASTSEPEALEESIETVVAEAAEETSEPEAPAPITSASSDSSETVHETETVLPPPPEDPFTVLVCRLADIAIGAGAPDVAAALPELLMDGRLSNDVGADSAAALAEAGIVVDGSVTATFAGQAAAWREILRGTSDDFDATGGAMLDEWAAEVLACLLGARSRGPSLKKDLRSRGVAAFGLVAAA